MKLKKFKRNAVLLTVIAFVCVAVYLNWSYNNKAVDGQDSTDAANLSETATSASPELFYQGNDPAEATSAPDGEQGKKLTTKAAEYFANARLTREQSRDSALEMLRGTAESDSAGAEAQTQAVAAMTVLSDNALKEGQIENMLIAKGFADCVVYIDNEDISVIVPSEATGLSDSEVARITEVVLSETAMSADQLTIIEVK